MDGQSPAHFFIAYAAGEVRGSLSLSGGKALITLVPLTVTRTSNMGQGRWSFLLPAHNSAAGKDVGLGSSLLKGAYLPRDSILSTEGRVCPSYLFACPLQYLELLDFCFFGLCDPNVSLPLPPHSSMCLSVALEQPLSDSMRGISFTDLRAHPIHPQRWDHEEGTAGFGSANISHWPGTLGFGLDRVNNA